MDFEPKFDDEWDILLYILPEHLEMALGFFIETFCIGKGFINKKLKKKWHLDFSNDFSMYTFMGVAANK